MSGRSLPTAMATVTGGSGSGCHWKNDRIVIVEVPVDRLSFLFVTVVNELESTNMLVAFVFWSCGKQRKSVAMLGWNAIVIGIV